eukprot:tig00000983_g5913.t1
MAPRSASAIVGGLVAAFVASLVLGAASAATESKALGMKVLKPDAGTIYYYGSTYVIQWASPGVSYVDIAAIQMYSVWSATINIVENLPDTQGAFPWTVPTNNPSLASGWYSIRVRGSQNGWVSDSSAYFQITAPSISALPVPSTAVVAAPFPIAWSGAGDYPVVVATLQREENGAWVDDRVISAAVPNTQMYAWMVPSDLQARRKYRVSLSPGTYPGASSATGPFTVSAGEVQASISGAGYSGGPLLPSKEYTVEWSSRGTVTSVVITLTFGTRTLEIASGGPRGSASFTVPAGASGEAQLSVCSPDCKTQAAGREEAPAGESVSVVAPASLTILPAVVVITAPDPGTVVRPRDTLEVRWTSTAVLGAVDIGILPEGAGPTAAFARTLASGLAAAGTQGSFAWSVPEDAPAQAAARLAGLDVGTLAGAVGGSVGGALVVAAVAGGAFWGYRRMRRRRNERVAPAPAGKGGGVVPVKSARASIATATLSIAGEIRKPSMVVEAPAQALPQHVAARPSGTSRCRRRGRGGGGAGAGRGGGAGAADAGLPAGLLLCWRGLLGDASAGEGRRGTPEPERERNASMRRRQQSMRDARPAAPDAAPAPLRNDP